MIELALSFREIRKIEIFGDNPRIPIRANDLETNDMLPINPLAPVTQASGRGMSCSLLIN